ncbi:MAG TPA: hypothetical protein VGM05_07645 [Planctomycetaceae bacterium]
MRSLSSTLVSITGAIAKPRSGVVPSSQVRTKSVTSNWYTMGGSAPAR